jgi:hypothetical protein
LSVTIKQWYDADTTTGTRRTHDSLILPLEHPTSSFVMIPDFVDVRGAHTTPSRVLHTCIDQIAH